MLYSLSLTHLFSLPIPSLFSSFHLTLFPSILHPSGLPLDSVEYVLFVPLQLATLSVWQG